VTYTLGVCIFRAIEKDQVMYRRINISLPEETIELLDRVTTKGNRSHVIAEAVTKYVADMGKARLRQLMKERAIKRADLDLQIAADWFPVDEQSWERVDK